MTLSGKVLINITLAKKGFPNLDDSKTENSNEYATSLFRVIQIQKVFLNHYYFMKIDLIGLLMITLELENSFRECSNGMEFSIYPKSVSEDQ